MVIKEMVSDGCSLFCRKAAWYFEGVYGAGVKPESCINNLERFLLDGAILYFESFQWIQRHDSIDGCEIFKIFRDCLAYQIILDGIKRQFGILLHAHFFHNPRPVCTDRLGAEAQFLGNFTDRFA